MRTAKTPEPDAKSRTRTRQAVNNRCDQSGTVLSNKCDNRKALLYECRCSKRDDEDKDDAKRRLPRYNKSGITVCNKKYKGLCTKKFVLTFRKGRTSIMLV
jgi:hypothetical protein